MKKPTVTIGVPAYNEEGNIHQLLKNLLKQKLENAILQEVLVISDGSTDNTVKKVFSVKNKIIKLIVHKKREGLYKCQNEIVTQSKSEILVLIDADVLPSDNKFIENLIKPIVKNSQIGIVGADTATTLPKNFLEKILINGRELKKNIYEGIKNGSNVYLCHGRARAFSRSLYKQIKWPKDCPEDSYSYLFCIKKGYKFVFSKDAKVLFNPPSSLSEYYEKSKRFSAGKKTLKEHFPDELLRKSYHLPTRLVLKRIIVQSLSKPLTTLLYILLLISAKLVSDKSVNDYSMWKISETSKRVIN